MLRIALVVLMILASDAVRAQTPTPTPPSVDPRLGCSTVKDFPEPDLGEPQAAHHSG
jgi:hypothetical protein